VRTIAVGVAPQDVAVEARSGRVVVVDSGGAMHVPQNWPDRWLRQVAGETPWLGRLLPHTPDVTLVPGRVSVVDTGQL